MAYLVLIILSFFLLIALGFKWEIKLKIVVPWAIFMGILEYVTIYILNESSTNLSIPIKVLIGLAQTLLITATVILLFFFRDPTRTPPLREGIIVSPADGKVLYINEIKKGEFPFSVKGKNAIPLKEFTGEEFLSGRGIHIGIGMNLLNVHINRAPIQGKILKIKRISGRFSSLKMISSLLENERVLTLIDGVEIKIGVVQIASRLVRRIISYLKEGENVKLGQKLGVILFGSQVDLLIPVISARGQFKIAVKRGEEVKAGISILASY